MTGVSTSWRRHVTRVTRVTFPPLLTTASQLTRSVKLISRRKSSRFICLVTVFISITITTNLHRVLIGYVIIDNSGLFLHILCWKFCVFKGFIVELKSLRMISIGRLPRRSVTFDPPLALFLIHPEINKMINDILINIISGHTSDPEPDVLKMHNV